MTKYDTFGGNPNCARRVCEVLPIRTKAFRTRPPHTQSNCHQDDDPKISTCTVRQTVSISVR
jgi:hypothetical protein